MIDVLPNLKDWALRAKAPFGKPANIPVIIPGGEVVEVTIGIPFLAGEPAGVIACAGLISYRTEDVVLTSGQHILVVIG